MNKAFLFVLASIGLFAASANADDILCGNVDHRLAKEGTTCITSRNVKFQLMKRILTGADCFKRRRNGGCEVWKDLSTQLIWSDATVAGYTFLQAQSACKHFTTFDVRGLPNAMFELPEISDFTTGAADGFDEVLPMMSPEVLKGYWSSTPAPTEMYYPMRCGLTDVCGKYIALFMTDGNVYAQDDLDKTYMLRCVSRPKP